MVRNSLSFLQCHLAFPPNEREGMSDISFSSPEICIGISGEALATLSRTANIRSIAAAVIECAEVIFVSHEIVGELSLRSPMCLFSSEGSTCSITSHRSSPPAHSKSEFVIFPSGFACDITRARTSSGHSSRKTVGMISSFSPTTMPPTPSFDASTIPMASGWPVISCVHFVGALVASCKIVRHPCNS